MILTINWIVTLDKYYCNCRIIGIVESEIYKYYYLLLKDSGTIKSHQFFPFFCFRGRVIRFNFGFGYKKPNKNS